MSDIDQHNEPNRIKKDCETDTWAALVDTEICLKNKLLSSNSFDAKTGKTSKASVTSYSIADIIVKDPGSGDLNDLTILEYQTYLSSHLKKYVKQCFEDQNKKLGDNPIVFDYGLHLSKFEWLAKASKYLSNKLSLTISTHRISPDMSIIPRSSYKFCEYNYDCEFNYKNKSSGCFAQHFVHNLVYADIMAIIQYLKANCNDSVELNFEELTKCTTTVAYVIKHMFEELSNLQFHHGNLNGVHIEKSVMNDVDGSNKNKIGRNYRNNRSGRTIKSIEKKGKYDKIKRTGC